MVHFERQSKQQNYKTLSPIALPTFFLHNSMQYSSNTSSSPPGRTGMTHLGFEINSSSLLSFATGKFSMSSWSVWSGGVEGGGGSDTGDLEGGGGVGRGSFGSPTVILIALFRQRHRSLDFHNQIWSKDNEVRSEGYQLNWGGNTWRLTIFPGQVIFLNTKENTDIHSNNTDYVTLVKIIELR